MDAQDVQKAVSGTHDAITAKRVFGKPYERNGVVVIPAAKIAGGGGGGGGQGEDGSKGSGFGFGFGLGGQPVGAYVIKGGKVRWKPAFDLNALVSRTQTIAILALLLALARGEWRRRRRR